MKNQDEYLKMVLALPNELFKEWEWNAGDRAIISGKEVLVLGPQNEYIWYYDRGELVFSREYIKNDIAMVHKQGIRSLPKQDQLQDLYIKFQIAHNKVSEGKAFTLFVGHFADFIMRKHDSCYNIGENWDGDDDLVELNSMDIWTLQFVAEIIYGLVWNSIEEGWDQTKLYNQIHR